MVKTPSFLIPFLILLVTAGCGQGGRSSAVIEAYIESLVAGDSAQAVSLSCIEWEEQAVAEAESFEAVEVELSGLKCSERESSEGEAVVSCEGEILVDYEGEEQILDLHARSYLAVLEQGDWRMCGYTR